jgi:prophage regulatory protein
MSHHSTPLPEVGYVRLPQIIGDRKAGIPAIIPVSKSAWWAGVKSGRYPQSVKLSERTTAWRVEDIRALIEQKSAA